MNETVVIDILGHQGDGVSSSDGTRIFVPYSLAGERVEISGKSARRDLIKVLQPASGRIEPVCEYFGTCGGCQVQHLAQKPYLEWKQNLVADAFAGADIDIAINTIISFDNAKRRRAVFSASNSGEGVNFGFVGKASHDIVRIENCSVLDASISSRIDTIKKVIQPILPAKGVTPVHVLASENGLDVHLNGVNLPNEKSRQAAVRRALDAGIARLSFGGETLVETKRPLIKMGIANVSPPPGSFVQAVYEAELKMVELVSAHLKKCKKTADLFCGIGAFALPMAEHSTVFACENDQLALDALDEAWRGTGGRLKAVTTQKRDLFLRPMMVEELKKIQGVVFDPPRAGAQAQAKQLAGSKVRKIAAVSCNPVTLVRDVVILIKGGFKVVSITPIDQFAYTPHVEVIVLLER